MASSVRTSGRAGEVGEVGEVGVADAALVTSGSIESTESDRSRGSERSSGADGSNDSNRSKGASAGSGSSGVCDPRRAETSRESKGPSGAGTRLTLAWLLSVGALVAAGELGESPVSRVALAAIPWFALASWPGEGRGARGGASSGSRSADPPALPSVLWPLILAAPVWALAVELDSTDGRPLGGSLSIASAGAGLLLVQGLVARSLRPSGRWAAVLVWYASPIALLANGELANRLGAAVEFSPLGWALARAADGAGFGWTWGLPWIAAIAVGAFDRALGRDEVGASEELAGPKDRDGRGGHDRQGRRDGRDGDATESESASSEGPA